MQWTKSGLISLITKNNLNKEINSLIKFVDEPFNGNDRKLIL